MNGRRRENVIIWAVLVPLIAVIGALVLAGTVEYDVGVVLFVCCALLVVGVVQYRSRR